MDCTGSTTLVFADWRSVALRLGSFTSSTVHVKWDNGDTCSSAGASPVSLRAIAAARSNATCVSFTVTRGMSQRAAEPARADSGSLSACHEADSDVLEFQNKPSAVASSPGTGRRTHGVPWSKTMPSVGTTDERPAGFVTRSRPTYVNPATMRTPLISLHDAFGAASTNSDNITPPATSCSEKAWPPPYARVCSAAGLVMSGRASRNAATVARSKEPGTVVFSSEDWSGSTTITANSYLVAGPL